MIKKINNSQLKINDIFRLSASSKSRLDQIRLDKNERADLHLSFFFNKLNKSITSDLISAYPEFDKIYKILSKKLKVSSKNIVFTAGSDQAIKNTFELFYKRNTEVITIRSAIGQVFDTTDLVVGSSVVVASKLQSASSLTTPDASGTLHTALIGYVVAFLSF